MPHPLTRATNSHISCLHRAPLRRVHLISNVYSWSTSRTSRVDLLEPHYGTAWSSSMVDEDAVFLWTSRCVASRVRNARCIRAILSTFRLSCPRLRSLFVSACLGRLCVCSPLCRRQAMLGGRWLQLAARGPPWPRCGPCVCVVWLVAVVQPPGDVETVSMLHGMSGQRPCRWRRAVDDTGHEGGSSAPGEGGRGRGVADGGRGAGSLRPRGRSRRVRSTLCVACMYACASVSP